MTKPLNDVAAQELANFQNYQAQVTANLKLANIALERFIGAVNMGDNPMKMPAPRSSVRCVREWTEWLRVNGPALRSTITESTGVRFKEQGYQFTVKWYDYMERDEPEGIHDDTIVRFTVPRESRGGSPVVFALWHQRYDVYPLFGVGPRKDGAGGPQPATVLGVVPPNNVEPPEQMTTDRCLDLDEWELMHRGLVKAVKDHGATPTPDERKLVVDSCPEGYPIGEAVAMLFARTLHKLDPDYGEGDDVSFDD